MAQEILDGIKQAEREAKDIVDKAAEQAQELIATAKKTAQERADYEMTQWKNQAQSSKEEANKAVESEKIEFDEQTRKQCDEQLRKLSALKQRAADTVIHLVTESGTE